MSQLVIDTMNQALANGSNPAGVIRRALLMQSGGSFTEWADAFAVFASWEGKRVVVDNIAWTPPLVEEGAE